jgi:RNA-binding protein
METLRGAARTYLRGLAHHLKPVAFVGKSGLTPQFLDSVDQALEAHELIKVRFVEFKRDKKALARQIEEATHSELVGLIGHVAIFYREHHDAAQRKIHIPEAKR